VKRTLTSHVASLLILALLFALPMAAQPQAAPAKAPQKAAPAKAAPPAKTLAKTDEQRLAGFDAFVTERLKEWKVPGVALSVVKDGKVIYARGFGLRDVENNQPVSADTLFAIGSCSKAFTATSLGILVSEGKLEWDKAVISYLPDFRMQDDYVTMHMTPRDLVTHRSGLPRHDLLWYGSSFTRKEMFDRLRYLEPSRGFRAQYQYQNLMFMTAGYLLEKITGQTWERFIQQRYFEPLGMKTSNVSVTASQKAADFAKPYNEEKDVVKLVPFRNIDAIGPAGSINSSVNEMANWVLANLQKGKLGDKQVIPEAALREPHTPQIISSGTMQFDEVSFGAYGMGWGVNMYRGHLRLSHGGGIDGFSALVSMLPRKNMGMVILTNLGGTPLPGILSNELYDRLLDLEPIDWNKRIRDERDRNRAAQEKQRSQPDSNRKPNTKPTLALGDYAGKFEHAGYGVLTIALEGDALKAAINGISAPLRHYHYDIFEIAEGQLERQKVTFQMNQRGEIERLSVALEPAVAPITFTRVVEAKPLEKAVLEKLTGKYEVQPGVEITVSLRSDGAFIFSFPGQPDRELINQKGLQFVSKALPPGFMFEFHTDANGVAIEIVVTQPNGVFTFKKK
jgi:CubicO group peptidase (beta-lactamase class C family)